MLGWDKKCKPKEKAVYNCTIRGAFFVWRAPIVSWPRIMCSQVHMLKILEVLWESERTWVGEQENISLFSRCSELTPRAPIPDGRMEQIMQPCVQLYLLLNLADGSTLNLNLFLNSFLISKEMIVLHLQQWQWSQQCSTNCSILPSRIGEHGGSWENMENMENTENLEIWKTSTRWLKTVYLWLKTLYLWLKTLFLATRWLKTPYFTVNMSLVEKTHMKNMVLGQLKMGEHQPMGHKIVLKWYQSSHRRSSTADLSRTPVTFDL